MYTCIAAPRDSSIFFCPLPCLRPQARSCCCCCCEQFVLLLLLLLLVSQTEALETALATELLLRSGHEGDRQPGGPPPPPGGPPIPSRHQLWLLVLAGSIPFVGFGFVDNFVMIIAGDVVLLVSPLNGLFLLLLLLLESAAAVDVAAVGMLLLSLCGCCLMGMEQSFVCL